MTFDGEYFQQIFGLIMGTNVAPILTNIHIYGYAGKRVKSEVQNWPQTSLSGQFFLRGSLMMVLVSPREIEKT